MAERRGVLRLLASRARPAISSRAPRFPPPHRFAAADRVLYNQLSNALAAAAASHATGTMLDVGCGSKPWAPLFAPHVAEHLGVDIAGDRVDIVADAYRVPLEDASVDTVLLTEVLEHLEDPARALCEAHRLLRPGGGVILTTPLLFPVHGASRDFYRYTPHGLEYLLREAGFEQVSVQPLSGQWTTIAMLRGLSLYPYRRGRLLRTAIDAFAAVSLALAVRLDEVDFRAAFSWNHIAVARKRLPVAER
jgi:SAM-dependent methyltransferase